MENFSLEKKDDEIYNKTDFLIRGDYSNEISFLKDIIESGELKKINIRHIKTLEERYTERFNRSEEEKEDFKKYSNSITNYFNEINRKFCNENEIKLFWKKKEHLDSLIKLLNDELSKEKESRDEISIKKIYNKVCLIVFTKESPDFVHTPFPEVEKIN